MDPQLPSAPSRKPFEPLIMLVVFLGIGAAVFAILAITFFSQASSAKSQLKSAQAASYKAGQADQKSADETLQRRLSESPFATYSAPKYAGSYVINYPKGWNGKVDECSNCSTLDELYLSPKLVYSSSGQYGPTAIHILLVSQSFDQATSEYARDNGNNKLKKSSVTVSGISGARFDGAFSKFSGSLVAIPVRDKTLLFWNENTQYKPEFEEVLAQAKVNP